MHRTPCLSSRRSRVRIKAQGSPGLGPVALRLCRGPGRASTRTSWHSFQFSLLGTNTCMQRLLADCLRPFTPLLTLMRASYSCALVSAYRHWSWRHTTWEGSMYCCSAMVH